MNNRKQGACGRVDIGGQAVLEGVMMKAPDAIAISVRRPNGTIVTRRTPYVPLSKKHPWMGWPIVRGIVNFVTMLSMGMSVLQQSTDMLGMLDEEPSKFEKWLSQKLGKGIDKIVMAVAIVLAVILSIGLFFVIPELFARLLKAWMPDPSSNWLINLLSGILRILILIGYILFCAKVPDVRRTFEYHGAEHKTVYCNARPAPHPRKRAAVHHAAPALRNQLPFDRVRDFHRAVYPGGLSGRKLLPAPWQPASAAALRGRHQL